MNDLIITVFCFSLIATIACANFSATRAAGVRRMAEAQLSACRKGTRFPHEYRPCYTDVQAYCRAQGLERTCGEGSP